MRIARRGRRPAAMMSADDALYILRFLQEAGVATWADGGWGVDALIGQRTRQHADLDIAVRSADEQRFRTVAGSHGFFEVSAEPHNPVLRDGAGRLLDVHFFDPSVVRKGPRGQPVYGDIAYDVGAFSGSGTIDGVPVPCLTAEFQVRSHAGYAFDADDLHDVLALHRRFGVPLPEEYLAFVNQDCDGLTLPDHITSDPSVPDPRRSSR